MASPPAPVQRALTTIARAPRPLVIAIVAVAAGLALLAAWMLPATASEHSQTSTTIVGVETDPTATPDPAATPAKVPKPKAATRTTKARNVPERPRDTKHHGKRIVYDKAL
ncbi:MAG: hypothetical protein NTX29_12895, partial [Actinobacteria bacterium]|nr:hypothetical protein [Actinomycetota bacterium]